jgi:hypothetical protein
MPLPKSKAVKHKDFLSLLSKSKSKKRRDQLIDLATKNEICAIIECVYNFLKGRVKHSHDQKQKLARYKNALRKVAQHKGSVKNSKQIIKQEGGFLPALIPLALGAIGKILPKLF